MTPDWLELSEWGDMVADLAVYGPSSTLIAVFHDVTTSPVRSHGTWAIDCVLPALGRATVIIEGATVVYMAMLNVRDMNDLDDAEYTRITGRSAT
jgi:hypothetical protein